MSDIIVKEAVLSAVVHPQYKLKWLVPDKRDNVTQLFLNSVIRLNESSAVPQTSARISTDDDYGFDAETTTAVTHNYEQVTVMQYFS